MGGEAKKRKCGGEAKIDGLLPEGDSSVNREIYQSIQPSACATLHAALRERALCSVPGFLTAEGCSALLAEAQLLKSGLKPRKPCDGRSAYSWMDNTGFDESHPRGKLHRTDASFLPGDAIPDDCLLRRLYESEKFTTLVSEVAGERLYRCEDKYRSLVISYMREDDLFGWHFDTNCVVVTLALAAPDAGGVFQWAPFIREDGVPEDAAHYEAMAEVFGGTSALTKQLPTTPGTLVLFRGRRSVHGVTPIRGGKERIVALLSYDTKPGMWWEHLRAAGDPDPEWQEAS